MTRRELLLTPAALTAAAQEPGQRPAKTAGVEVVLPRARVPVSLIIDDSTCLVNLNRFAIPQFRAAWQNKSYDQDWRSMPHEIPDDFVRKFGNWCGENGVKGKYSIVPFPACVGRLDLGLPGWTREELAASIRLVQDLMTPNWDIHPEMVTHTRIIDVKTGHPYPEMDLEHFENWKWCGGKPVEMIADYIRYALRILHNIGFPCEGITTPGGFGADALPQLAQATMAAVRDVYRAEVPHYFRHAFAKGTQSVAPRVEYAAGLDSADPRCVVSIIGCTGDWTGNWDASQQPNPDLFITRDLSAGRLVDVIGRNEPACLLCHWTGIHYNGRELGFQCFQEVVRRLHSRYDNLVWMKLSEIARYWAALELTRIERQGGRISFRSPFACPDFTIRAAVPGAPAFAGSPLRAVNSSRQLAAGTWHRQGDSVTMCFDLPKGDSFVLFT
jgi:hypothetical protein